MKSEQTPNFTLGLKRPAWVSSKVRQRSVVVGDGSPSMAGDKSRNAEEAIRQLIEELAAPTNCRF